MCMYMYMYIHVHVYMYMLYTCTCHGCLLCRRLFVLDNFAFYSALLMEIIGRSFQLDLTSDQATILYRVTKVHLHMYEHVHLYTHAPNALRQEVSCTCITARYAHPHRLRVASHCCSLAFPPVL